MTDKPDEKKAAPQPAPAPVVLPVTEWARRKSTPAIWLKAAALGSKWDVAANVVVTETTESAFDDAIHLAMHGKPRTK